MPERQVEEQQAAPMGEEDVHQFDLVSEREIQAYNLIKDRLFVHTPVYDDELLSQIGMDFEFLTICKAVGWENVDPMNENGSHFLTI